MLALITVDTDQDIVDFNDGVTSLREAIFAANTVPGADEIVFDLSEGPKTILLTQGELKITDSLTIMGSGAELLTIDASGIQDVNASSVFNISDGNIATAIDASIHGLTLTGAQNSAIRNRENLTLTSMILSGNKSTAGGAVWMDQPYERSLISLNIIDSTITNNSARSVGGAIYFGGDNDQISIRDSVISDNKVDSTEFGWGGALFIQGSRNHVEVIDTRIESNSAPNGGGIYVTGAIDGDVHIIGSSISHNTALSSGGGIYARVSYLHIERSAITENVAENGSLFATGGGLRFSGIGDREVVINESTISGNSATSMGGGIDVDGSLSVTQSTFSENSSDYGGAIHARGLVLRSSTVSGNTAQSNGGGIFSSGYATIVSSTISANSAGYQGGGISARHTLLEGSLVAKNTAPTMPDVTIRLGTTVGYLFKSHHSLIGYSTSPILSEAPVGSPDANGNIIGGAIYGAIDPMLGPLADNGGPTKTHALLPGSPAVNAGDPTAVAGANGVPEFDQRGEPFTRVFGGRIDIGALEAQSLIVDTLVDENDGDYSEGDFSLREAIELANQIPEANTIEFAPSLVGGTILLSMGEIVITDSVEIVGLGSNALIIDAQYRSRIFNIVGTGDYVFEGMTLYRGATRGSNVNSEDTTYSGGAIRSVTEGLLTLEDCNITFSVTSGRLAGGGALFAIGDVVVQNSMMEGNRIQVIGNGGAIYVAGDLQLASTTIRSNEIVRGSGGGIYTGGDFEAVNSHIIGNFLRDGSGGGIVCLGSVDLANSTVRGNSSTLGAGGISASEVIARQSVISDNSTVGTLSNGGGIRADKVLLVECHLSNNSTTGQSAHGGAVSAGDLEVVDSVISGNKTSGRFAHGGGLYAGRGLVITRTIVEQNYTSGRSAYGGGVAVRGNADVIQSTITNNRTTADIGFGGGVYVSGNLALKDSTVSGNSTMGETSRGGGVFCGTYATLYRSELLNNATHGEGALGGGLFVGSPFLTSNSGATFVESLISGNSTHGSNSRGGGVYSRGFVKLDQTTVSDNGTLGNGSNGGAIAVLAYLNAENSTIVHNNASQNSTGGGVWSISAEVRITGSIVSSNSTTDISTLTRNISAQYSLIGTNAGTNFAEAPVGSPDANGNIIGGAIHGVIDPLLAPLADNGGPTKTHALLPGSPAINAGDPSLVLGHNGVPEFDQRGAPFTRIAGGRVDIGAYESQPDQGTFNGDFDGDGDVDGRDLLIWQRGFGASPPVSQSSGDATGDGDVDGNDLAVWQATYGGTIGGPRLVDLLLANDSSTPLRSSEYAGATAALSGSSMSDVDATFDVWPVQRPASADFGEMATRRKALRAVRRS